MGWRKERKREKSETEKEMMERCGDEGRGGKERRRRKLVERRKR